MVDVVRIPAGMTLPEEHASGVAAVCRCCGCTDDRPCLAGCAWETADRDLCTRCAERVLAIINPSAADRELVAQSIGRETSLNVLALALHYAAGDWRRAMIRDRGRELAGTVMEWAR